jgi:hypothetical protein
MELTAEQKETISQWVADGAAIADVQKRLNEEFEFALTYMEARFLIDDLDLNLKDSEIVFDNTDLGTGVAATDSHPPPQEPQTGPADALDLEPVGTGSVSIEVDTICRPGMVVSGSVIFSDGVKATWALDQMGRLALDPGQSGYQPSAEDIENFQKKLSKQLQKKGF